MCEQLLANPLIESYEIELRAARERTPRLGRDRRRRLPGLERRPRRAARARARSAPTRARVWHAEDELPDGTAAVVLPGGFSYGDYLRCGAIARFSPVMARRRRVRRRRRARARDLQRLPDPHARPACCPGVLRPNASLSFVCRDVALRVERDDTPFTSRCEPGQTLTIPVKHGEGCWFADDELLARARGERPDPAPLRAGENPNGAVADVAGVVQRRTATSSG